MPDECFDSPANDPSSTASTFSSRAISGVVLVLPFIVQGPDSGVYGRTRHPPTCSEGFIRARGTTGCLAILLRMRYLVPSGFLVGNTERTNERTNDRPCSDSGSAGRFNFRNSQALTGMFSATLPAP